MACEKHSGNNADIVEFECCPACLMESVESLREQLIQMCRVFHAEDCVCKWCNIVKERAAKSMEEMGFKPVEQPKKPYNPDDYPLNSDSTCVDKRNLRSGER